jgi:hypothetical protein
MACTLGSRWLAANTGRARAVNGLHNNVDVTTDDLAKYRMNHLQSAGTATNALQCCTLAELPHKCCNCQGTFEIGPVLGNKMLAQLAGSPSLGLHAMHSGSCWSMDFLVQARAAHS